MAKRKVYLEFSEKRERIRIRRSRKQTTLEPFCRKCRQEVEWLTLTETAELTGRPLAEIRDQLENGQLDMQITDDGLLYICSRSALGSAE